MVLCMSNRHSRMMSKQLPINCFLFCFPQNYQSFGHLQKSDKARTRKKSASLFGEKDSLKIVGKLLSARKISSLSGIYTLLNIVKRQDEIRSVTLDVADAGETLQKSPSQQSTSILTFSSDQSLNASSKTSDRSSLLLHSSSSPQDLMKAFLPSLENVTFWNKMHHKTQFEIKTTVISLLESLQN